MNIEELKKSVTQIIENIKNGIGYPKECEIDYKRELNIDPNKSGIDNFLINFFKDILSFANGNGGYILIGIEEDKQAGKYHDIGLDEKNLKLLSSLDIHKIVENISGHVKAEPSLDVQAFNMCGREFYYLLIEKSPEVLIPNKDIPEYKIKSGEIWYRNSGGNCHANTATSKINTFIQIKANEKSKDFMTIWSNLLPEMIDINPKEVLILNVADQKVYGFNKKGGKLDGGTIEVDDKSDTFKIILKSIQEGEIGKISNTEGKPMFRIVGDMVDGGDPLTGASEKIKNIVKYYFTNKELRDCLYYLGYTTIKNILHEASDSFTGITDNGKNYIFRICIHQSKGKYALRLSSACVENIINLVKDESKHTDIFSKVLSIPKQKN